MYTPPYDYLSPTFLRMLFSAAFESNVPSTLKIKLFPNPPDGNGNYSLKQKRIWHFSPAEKDEMSLASTLKLFQGYFGTTNSVEVSYFDGEEEMSILKDEDLREACSYFVQCYRQFENYQAFVKIYLTERVKQNTSSAIVKLPEGNLRSAGNLYKKITAAPSVPNVSGSTVSTTKDQKLDKMKLKVTKEYNAREVQAEVVDKSSIKCANCKMIIKLGKPYNIHNFKKHRERCQKTASTGTQSIATLFLAMTAVAQQVRSKAEAMIAKCQQLKDDGLTIDDLLET